MRFVSTAVLAATAISIAMSAAPAAAQSSAEQARFDAAQQRFDSEYRIYRDAVDRYAAARRDSGRLYRDDYDNHPADRPPATGPGGYRLAPDDRDENGYDPARDYSRDGQERVLRNDERVYAGEDGRYYCKRSDGTTGLIVGGAAGGILGNVIDGGHSRTVGTLLGGAVGAIAGRSIEQRQSEIRCR